VVASGQTAVLDHLEVCSDVFLVRRAGVAEDIDKPGIYAGAPVEPYARYLKNTAVARDLAGLRKKVRQLERAARETRSPEAPGE
jgi:UDP-3-O-[3-hydroxymyristoyl] glucosamine N-acyltransferase